jgi:hypothetical protein
MVSEVPHVSHACGYLLIAKLSLGFQHMAMFVESKSQIPDRLCIAT